VGSIAEYLDLEVEMGQEADFQHKLNPALPAGMQILMQKTIFAKVPSLASTIGQLTYETDLEEVVISPDWLDGYLSQPTIMIERQLKEGNKSVDIRPFIKKLELSDHRLVITLIAIEGRMAKVTEVLESLLGKQGIDHRNFYTQRTGQFIVTGDKVQEPFEVI
jgi:radical SAM-linked protein